MSGGSTTVPDLRSDIDDFVASLLEGYEPRIPPDDKVIHDPIWGTHRFCRHEVVLIDSPVIQRLRRIHQTGFSFLTFPGTTHTRFEHSLGAAIVAGSMAHAVARRHQNRIDLDPLKGDLAQLRAAALLHDCGHGFASHVSEGLYKWLPAVLAASTGKLADAKPSEVLSWHVITSKPFRDFVAKVNAECNSELDLDLIADLVLGLAPQERSFLAEFINGPFDADRIDYILRDAYFSGLKTGVDVERLLHDMEVGLLQDGKPHLLLRSTHVIEQLLWTKVHFFARVYRHQKVLAADGAVQSLISQVRELGTTLSGATFSRASDYLKITDTDLLAAPGDNVALDIRAAIENLRRRKLPHRCLAVTTYALKAANEPISFIQKLQRLNETADGLSNLRREIWERVQGTTKPALSSIVLAFPSTPPLREASQTYVLLRGRSQPETLSALFRIDEWLTTYNDSHWAGYVFGDLDFADATAQAAIEVLASSPALGVKLDSSIATSVRKPAPPSPFPDIEVPPRARRIFGLTSPHLPVLESFVQGRLSRRPNKPFESLHGVLILHFLSDLPPLLQRFESLGLDPRRTWLVRKPYRYPFVEETMAKLASQGYNMELCTAAEGPIEPARRVLHNLQHQIAATQRFIVVEDGGYVAPLLHNQEFAGLRERCLGVVEQTTKGIRNVRAIADAGGLRIPVVSVAESWLKQHLEAPEVGDALAFALEEYFRKDLGRPLTSQSALVLGYGAVGRGLCMSLTNRGARISVFDTDSRRAIEASAQRPYNFSVITTLDDLSPYALIVGTTGTTSLKLESMLTVRDGVILASGSSDRLEFDIDGLRSRVKDPVDDNIAIEGWQTKYRLNDGCRVGVLCDGYPINFVIGEGIAKSVIDPILAELVAGAVLLADSDITGTGVHQVPQETEEELWTVYRQLTTHS